MQRLGPYEVRGELGRGGMGVVYRGRRSDLGRDVALKVLALPQGEELQRFEREAAALARLRHPNVVAVHEAGRTEQGAAWLAMELVEGRSLAERLADGPLEVEQAVDIARQVCQALVFSHQRGVLHRDLKPGNILIDRDGRALLTDFGLAWLAADDRITRSGDVLGTPDFMSPEQARGEVASLGAGADIYGLGATLYASLTGSPPFSAPTVIGLLNEITTAPAPRPSAARPEVGEALDAICQRCLAKAPKDRYNSAAELGFALEAWSRSRRRQHTSGPARGRVWAGVAALVGVVGGVLVAGSGRSLEPASSARPSPTPATSSAPPRERSLAILEQKVLRAIRVCDWETARSLSGQALRQDPDCVWALAQRGLAGHCLGPSVVAAGDARRDLDRAVALDPASVLARRNRARLQRERGDHRGAAADLTAALRAKPRDPALLIKRAYLYARLSDDRARADVATIGEIAPGSVHALLASALTRRLANDERGALELVERALERDPSSTLALIQQSVLLHKLSRFQESLPVYARLVKAAPGSYLTWVGRASAYEELNQLHEALEYAREGVARMPEDHPMRAFYEREADLIRGRLDRRR